MGCGPEVHLTMRWPWGRRAGGQQLVVSWAGQQLAFVLADTPQDGRYPILKYGVEKQGTDSLEDFTKRLQVLGLKGFPTTVMMRPEQCQMLQIDAPAVPPEELRAAARYQIKELLTAHVDDITLDVMRVGAGEQKGSGQLFVAAATTTVLREVLAIAEAMNWTVSVIDIQESAQRNLQSAAMKLEGRLDRADATLMLDQTQAVLTISANEELFYTRRLELPDGFYDGSWLPAEEETAAIPDAYVPVQAYIPDFNVGGESHGTDYSIPEPDYGAATRGAIDPQTRASNEKVERFSLEVQRSMDIWSRTWSSLPLDSVRVYVGERSAELATWLDQQLGQSVIALDLQTPFPGFDGGVMGDTALCAPLLGVLLRAETRKL